MEITIGIQNLPRELTLETDDSAQDITAAIEAALVAGTPLTLTDTRGRRLVVPSGALGYVEIGAETQRAVGFGKR